MKFLLVTPDTTVAHLRLFLEQAGPKANIRREGDVLYCREGRKGNQLSHLAGYLTGHTKDKRGEVMDLVKQVFARDHIKLNEHIKAVLSPQEAAHLKAGHGDLKVEHLLKVFTGTVQVHGEDYRYERLKEPLNKGSYGAIYMGTGAHQADRLALKTPHQAVAEEGVALRKEAAIQLRARQAALSNVNYVVDTTEAVIGSDGRVFQPMGLALCSAEKLLDRFSLPDDELAVDSLMALTARDWAMSLVQIGSIDMAHRDFKPENLMLSQEGVWQLSDFGSAGDSTAVFTNAGGKKGSREMTGNRSILNKSPEWLRSELPRVVGEYHVGHADDVFALGVAVFRLVTQNKLPFEDPGQPPATMIDYEEAVLSYADSGKSFCQWYFEAYGQEIPLPWRDFFDQALHSDPAMRATAAELVDSPLFSPPSEAELRAQLVQMASAPAAG